MGRATQKKGDIALTQAIAKFTEIDFDVLLPVTESLPYDLVVDTGKELKKVQVKYHGGKLEPVLRMRKIHSNSKGYVVKRTSKTDYDWAFVYCSDGRVYWLTEQPNSVNTFKLQDPHLFGNVAERFKAPVLKTDGL